MPQLMKGGKWVFGWVTVTMDRLIEVPEDAWREYGFQQGEEAMLLRGSTTSGGFAVGIAVHMPEVLSRRSLGRSRFEAKRTLRLPDTVPVHGGQRLLVVRGSGHALGFLAQGRIFELALSHPLMQQP
jgi:hypothetical protein